MTDASLILQQFAKVRRLLNGRLSQKLRGFEIGPTQGILMRCIRRMRECSLAELSRETLTDPAATGKAVDCLIRQGWVQKDEHPTDRRQWVVSLTDEGKKVTRKLDPVWEDVAGELVGALELKEREEFYRFLTKAGEFLESETDKSKTER